MRELPAGGIHRVGVSATYCLNTHRVGVSARQTAARLAALPFTGIFGQSLADTPMGDMRPGQHRAPESHGHGTGRRAGRRNDYAGTTTLRPAARAASARRTS